MSAKSRRQPQSNPPKERPMCDCGRDMKFLPDIKAYICPEELKTIALSDHIVNSLAEKFHEETQDQIDKYHRESDRAMDESNRLLQQGESMVAQIQSGEMPNTKRNLSLIQAVSDRGKTALKRSNAADLAARVLASYQDPDALRRMIQRADLSGPPEHPRSAESIIRDLDNIIEDPILLEDRYEDT